MSHVLPKFYVRFVPFLTRYHFYQFQPWSTKYTAVYVTFEGQNLRGQLFKRTQQSKRGQRIV